MRILIYALLVTASSASISRLCAEWERYKVGLNFGYDSREDLYRFGVYVQNRAYVEKVNLQRRSYTLGMQGPFMHLTGAEFTERFTQTNSPQGQPATSASSESSHRVSDTVNWKSRGVVGPVSKQGSCLSCWAFAAANAIESCLAIKGSPLIALSIEEQIQCSSPYGNEGCKGGLAEYSFAYIKDRGLSSSAAYPYTGSDSRCAATSPTTSIRGWINVPRNQTNSLAAAVAINPVTVVVQASRPVFQFYQSGVLDSSECGINYDHTVLVVGMGTSSNGRYWLVKNSWGTDWGEQGYIRIRRDPPGTIGPGICGIHLRPVYPIC